MAGTCIKCLSKGGSWAIFVFVVFVMISVLIFLYWLVLKMGEDMMKVRRQ